jgi:hypothetical protein
MTDVSTPTPATESSADPGRPARIAEIYRRGLEAMRRSYDPVRHLVSQGPVRQGGEPTFRPPQSLWLAQALLREGDPPQVQEAAGIVSAVLDTQERSPNHPHRGNFLWLAGDEEVVDLNAVQFALRALLPLLVLHEPQLPGALQERSRDAVRLALEEEERMAVAPTYTNIHLQALFALLVGGEWLRDSRFIDLGLARWQEWMQFTVQSGTTHEYNSPGYGGIDLSALAALHQFVKNATVRLQARLMYERLWLHLALHLHRPTNQHAGPHCRCYWGAMMNGHSAVHDLLWRETGWPWLLSGRGKPPVPASLELALTEHWLPDPVRAWLEHQEDALSYEVRETANVAESFDLTTYFTPSYALGTAARTYGIGQDDYYIEHQANYLILHYTRTSPPDRQTNSPDWSMMYSRFVVNDRHFGTLAAAPDRPPNSFYDQGNFAGVQQRNKAIALYALQPQHQEIFSLKTVAVFPQAEALEEVRVNDRPITLDDLPLALNTGDWLVVTDGSVFIGVRPLEPSCLGREAPLLLERGPQGELWLTLYNYRGPAKRFWDYASLRGAFWRGNIRAGFIVEVSERNAFPSAAAFFSHLAQASIEDTVEETPESPARRTVTYRSGGDELRLEYDLWRTEPGRRWLDGQLYTPPALASPLAVQGNSGRLSVGSATLETAPQMVWLVAQEHDPGRHCWVAVNPADWPLPLRLETPLGVLHAKRWGLGRIEWNAPTAGQPQIVVESINPPDGISAPTGVPIVWRPVR